MGSTRLETEASARRHFLPFTAFRTRQASPQLSTRPGCLRVGVFLAVLGSRSQPVLANSMASTQPAASRTRSPAPASSTASSSLASRMRSSSKKTWASFSMTAPTSTTRAVPPIRIRVSGPSKLIRVSPLPLRCRSAARSPSLVSPSACHARCHDGLHRPAHSHGFEQSAATGPKAGCVRPDGGVGGDGGQVLQLSQQTR
jgi:hypothetical protein